MAAGVGRSHDQVHSQRKCIIMHCRLVCTGVWIILATNKLISIYGNKFVARIVQKPVLQGNQCIGKFL